MMTLLFAGLVAWIIFTFLVKVIKFTATTALLIVAVVVILQVTNGVTPEKLLKQLNQVPQSVQSSPNKSR
jgi:hypothetical protein